MHAYDQTNDIRMKMVIASDQDDETFIDYKEEIRSILVYIGLVTVILFLLLIIFSLICKCLKIFRSDTMKKKHPPMQSKQTSNHFLVNRHISTSSVASTALLMKYPTCQIAASQPSLSETLRMIHYREQQLSSITNV
ncbi:hypothetical protein I4U23_013639 [Adineta vaga]|nr:hypothetical protein I4U23_013639 [Adineta vaga]